MDKYDEAIEFLKAHPSEIHEAWSEIEDDPPHPAHCLFQAATKDGRVDSIASFGCLTQIRGMGSWDAATPELTEAIRADDRIPGNPLSISVDHLPVFAEWQRRIDRELGRK